MRRCMRTLVIILEGAEAIPELITAAEAGVASETTLSAMNAATETNDMRKTKPFCLTVKFQNKTSQW